MKARLPIVTLLFSIATLWSAETRTWTSRDGTATLQASLHKVDGEKVILLLPDGRTKPVEKKFLGDDDLAWIEQNASGGTAGENSGSGVGETAPIPAALKGNLIDDRGNPVDLGTREGGYPKYYMFYYSASWCPPCRSYTPEVVRMAKRMRSESFTVILVPSDHSLEDEIAYLKDYRMPWPGLKWRDKAYPGIPRNPGGGIPAARLVDAEGRTLLTTEDVNRMDFLDEVQKIVKNGAAGS